MKGLLTTRLGDWTNISTIGSALLIVFTRVVYLFIYLHMGKFADNVG